MKRQKVLNFLLVLLTIMTSTAIRANDVGHVEGVRNTLNVRTEPSKDARTLQQLRNNERVEVTDAVVGRDGSHWYKIKLDEGSTGYVSANYIHGVTLFSFDKNPYDGSSSKQLTSKRPHSTLFEHRCNWLIYVCLIMVLLISAMCSEQMDDTLADDGLFYAASGLFVVLSLIVIFYFAGHENPLWFVTPDTVGWFWTIVGGLMLLAFCINYAFCLIRILEATDYHGERHCHFIFGLYVHLICFGLWLFANIFQLSWADYALWSIAITQVVQVGYAVIDNMRKDGAWGSLAYAILIYILGIVASSLIVIAILPAIVIAGVVYVFGRGGEASAYDNYRETYTDHKGFSVSNERYGSDFFKDSKTGDTYKRDMWGNLHKQGL